MDAWLGIDPGASGALAMIDEFGDIAMLDFDSAECSRMAIAWTLRYDVRLCALEQVGAMPGQGVTSMFNFGANFGWWRGVLDTLRIPYVLVRPQRWGKDCCVPPKKDKADKPSLEVARRMFPQVDLSRKKDHGKADALLLAHWAKTFGGEVMKKVFGVIYVLLIAACVYCVDANQIQHATLFAALAMLNQRSAFDG